MNERPFLEFIKGKRVLVLEGYSRQALPYMRELKKMGMKVTLLCNSKIDCGYVSRFPDERILGICNPEDYASSEQYIIELIKNKKYDVVLPLGDFGAGILANNKIELSNYAKICTNDIDVFKISNDKLAVMKICMENKIPCPFTLFGIDNTEDVITSEIKFPIIIKPRRGCGAKGFHKFDNSIEFVNYVKENRINLKEMVVQECIPSNSLSASDNLFIDNDGNVKSSFLYGCKRVFPLQGGTGTFNITFDRKDIHVQCAKLANVLGLRGINGIDMMIDSRDQIAKVIEINPRSLACSKIGFIAGVNQARQVMEAAFSYPVTEYKTYKCDMRVRMMQIDTLWFLKSPDRFRSKPSWFSWTNTVDQTFSWDDPLPWFAFLIRGLLQIRHDDRV